MLPTRIVVAQCAGRHRLALSNGVLRAQQVHSRPGWCRVGLVATTALLLGLADLEPEGVTLRSLAADLTPPGGTGDQAGDVTR